MRLLYSLLFYLLTPAILFRLYWRGFKAPAYRQRWKERLGIYSQSPVSQVIWIHAVSVGESEAVFPLVRLIRQRHPQRKILITTTTPTGSARVEAVFGGSVEHVYLPYDLPFAIQRFIRHFQPRVAIIMETEIWPNLFQQCGHAAIPLFIVNARLSKKSAQGYHKIPSLVLPTLDHVKLIATQTVQDSERFLHIGAQQEQLATLGNIKFDLEISADLIQQGQKIKQSIFKNRLVWIIASTHKDEEEIFLHSYRKLKLQYPSLLLVLVPRHPERFSEVKSITNKNNLSVVMRTDQVSCETTTDVYIGDTMGELKMLYAAADLAFVGGSMTPIGGHNVLEPAALHVPVMFGPYMANFKDIAQGLLDANAAIQCQDEGSLATEASRLLGDVQSRANLAENADAFVKLNQGAIERVYQMLEKEF